VSKLLINEPPLQLLPTLAEAIGLNEALVLQQLHYHSLRSKDDGWVQRALRQWAADDFKFWSMPTFERAIRALRDAGLIEIETVAVLGGSGGSRREARIRVVHQALDALELQLSRSHQPDGTSNHQVDGTSAIKLMGPRTDLKEEEKQQREEASPPRRDRPEIARLCGLLAELMLANDPKAKPRPDSDRWYDACRLLLDRDARTADEIEHVIRFSQADSFWRSNVLSMPKLREQFGQLWLKAQGTTPTGRRRAAPPIATGTAIVEGCPNGTTDAAALAAWEPAKQLLLERLANEAGWIEPLHAHRLEGDDLVIACPLEIHGWIKQRFAQSIANAAHRPVRIVACGGHRRSSWPN
jgi:hypothetical protein